MPVSLKPSEMSAGGGLWSDVDATIIGLAFVWSKDTEYKSPNNIPLAKLEVKDDNGVEYEQLLACGGKGEPSEDGSTLEGVDSLNSGSNLGLLITSIVTSGFPENKIEDMNSFIGTKAHFERVAAPKRSGLTKAPRSDGKVYEDTVLIVTKVLKYPWEKEAGKKGGSPAPKGKAPAPKGKPSGGGDEISEAATEAVMSVLAENPDGVTKPQLSKGVFQMVKGTPNASAIVKMCINDEFLEAGPWSYEDGVVSM